jgi:hypothetical protein
LQPRCKPNGSRHKRTPQTQWSYAGVPLTGENALQRYDHHGLSRIRDSALADSPAALHQLTFLRMGSLMFDHWVRSVPMCCDAMRCLREISSRACLWAAQCSATGCAAAREWQHLNRC